jgi:octopine/nopaline transport system permease protein
LIDIAFLSEILPKLLSGVPLTLQLAMTSILLGFMLALLLALAQQRKSPVVLLPIRGFVALFRGTPLLVQIFLIYYGLGQFRPGLQAVGLWGLFREPYWCAILALTLNTAAYGSEILRGAFQSVPRGVVEAARASGMSPFLTWRLVVLPIAFRQAIPAYGNEIILMVKGTSLASIVTLMEVTGIAHGLISQTYRAIEVFVCAGAIYLILNFVIIRALAGLEYWLSPHLRRAP